MLNIICHQGIATKVKRYHYTLIRIAKIKKNLTIPITDEEQQALQSLLARMYSGKATLEDSLVLSYKAKNSLTIQSSNHDLKYLPK